jgi:hypothetical protein
MSQTSNTILTSWPALKEDLQEFLTDTDDWVINKLKNAYQAKDWEEVDKLIGVMELVHNLSHAH